MRVYFLVEGRRTESKVYVAWLSHLVPELVRVQYVDEPQRPCFFLISAEGYPSIISTFLPASIEDVNKYEYDYLVVCLDAEESSVPERIAEVNTFMERNGLRLDRAKLVIIVQNRCIETWFLGNQRIISRHPGSVTLRDYLAHYDVRITDPELMPLHPSFDTHAQFHLQYLREVFQEKNITYSKRNPGHVLEKAYLDRLMERVATSQSDLVSLQNFFNFCDQVRTEIAGGL